MIKKPGMFRATLVGGILFLLPLVVVALLLGKAFNIVRPLSDPIVRVLGITSVAGVAASTFVAITFLLLISFAAGMLARTRIGQMAFSLVENSVLSVVPQWRMAKGFVASFDADAQSDFEVVLVPTDAGWCLAFVLEKPESDWWTVFVPGAPQWTSGTVAFASSDQVHKTGLSAAQAIMLMRRCGAGSATIRELLSSLEKEKAL